MGVFVFALVCSGPWRSRTPVPALSPCFYYTVTCGFGTRTARRRANPAIPRVPQMLSRVRDFELLLGAGVAQDKSSKASVVSRFVESLAIASGLCGGGGKPATEPAFAKLPTPFPVAFANQIVLMQVRPPLGPVTDASV